jgi:hypothetical protein
MHQTLSTNEINARSIHHWNSASILPSPRIPLILKLENGNVIKGARPSYISSRDQGDLGYRDLENNPIFSVVSWQVQ